MALPAAEDAYVFRHALVRDAAYELQPPSARARLHGLALGCLEELTGGRPDETPVAIDDGATDAHPCDAVALQLADHAGLAEPGTVGDRAALRCLYLRRAAEHAERLHQYPQARQLWSQLIPLAQPGARPRCLLRLAMAAGRAGDNAAAVAALETLNADAALEPELRCMGHSRLSHFLRELGRHAPAEAAATFARELARASGLAMHEAWALGNLANLHRDTGRAAEAEQGYARALDVFQRLGNQRYAAVALGNLAALRQMAGDTAMAEHQYRRALQLCREAGDLRFEGISLGNLAIVLQQQARLVDAAQAYDQALEIHRRTGNRRSEGITLGNLAGMLRQAGQPRQALAAYESALAMHRELSNRSFEGAHLCYFALCLVDLRRADEARAAWRAGMAILHELGDRMQAERARQPMLETCRKAGMPPLDEPEAAP
ncbi:MAG: tetratricopeptide repeat protein [Planctomycetes bacterium]|nr:tetratricopeptide repeat protein [Planctomycetota bacterium]